MLIEPLPLPQIAVAIELWRECGLLRPWNDPEADIRRALAGPASTVLAGSADQLLVATAMLGHDGHRGSVYYLAVRGDQRGRGHGRTMMQACESWLAEREIPKLNIMVRGDHLEARGFYEALGYTLDDVIVLSHRL
jgi:ribosomal protein S18 acetylase RimI-like enzyme